MVRVGDRVHLRMGQLDGATFYAHPARYVTAIGEVISITANGFEAHFPNGFDYPATFPFRSDGRRISDDCWALPADTWEAIAIKNTTYHEYQTEAWRRVGSNG